MTGKPQNLDSVPMNERFTLTVPEAAIYFGIGVKRLRTLAESNPGSFAVFCGNRYLIIREKFEEYLLKSSAI